MRRSNKWNEKRLASHQTARLYRRKYSTQWEYAQLRDFTDTIRPARKEKAPEILSPPWVSAPRNASNVQVGGGRCAQSLSRRDAREQPEPAKTRSPTRRIPRRFGRKRESGSRGRRAGGGNFKFVAYEGDNSTSQRARDRCGVKFERP